MDCTICIATFGSTEWLARGQALQEAMDARFDEPVIFCHGETLAQARNAALAGVTTEYVVHLDADDELEPGYLEAMAAGTADVRAPAVRYVQDGRAHEPRIPQVFGHRHRCRAECLPQGNFIAVGACVRTELLRQVGGWEEWPLYEDWAAWWRCWRAGGTVESIPSAVYRATWRPDSRNRAPSPEEKDRVHRQIVDSVESGVRRERLSAAH